MNSHTTAVAVSGGIDSLYAAWLLKNAGHKVIGIHFITGYEHKGQPKGDTSPSPWLTLHSESCRVAIPAMNHVAEQLDIPIHIIDIRNRFEAEVVSHFEKAYRDGLTPNPCLLCNPTVKFGYLLDVAESLGARDLATGHYVRTRIDEADGLHLLKGEDPFKDQSYFLAMVPPERLAKAVFPLGGLRKEEIKKEAAQKGLTSFAKGESQDICFIQDGDYKAFLLSRPGFVMEPGPIVTEDGTEVGRHLGLHGFTVGQRRGINCPGPYPYYVLALEPEANRLVVGRKEALLSDACTVTRLNWIRPPAGTSFDAVCKIRYSHKGSPCRIELDPTGENATVTFDAPQSAVTPGQGAAFYTGDEVLGGGWISR
ncbi:tRNA 2-thiouridine(34) synthase MnmA [Desulfoluna spongiiphila]|uniref:tRNA 2-thiouridine(34) synthase MnmA n=1 Tax=Desulfoluna spongiiphila TaxID=419481 RepID=UPI001255EEB3|nr:tRNA 2-thiouridine(34) synthase MnmA [Desulfoluna spongiiphila]VVS91791.1 trna-specific 2-thiouridylase [Desulfoluna spongiiphila]